MPANWYLLEFRVFHGNQHGDRRAIRVVGNRRSVPCSEMDNRYRWATKKGHIGMVNSITPSGGCALESRHPGTSNGENLQISCSRPRQIEGVHCWGAPEAR